MWQNGRTNDMINFKICLDAEKASTLQNRMVECVNKTTFNHPLYGKISVWCGALENEYFSILFMGGVITVSVDAREFNIDKVSTVYAESQSLLDMSELVKGSTPEVQLQLRNNYLAITDREQSEMTFADLMFILNWQYVEGARVDETDLLGV